MGAQVFFTKASGQTANDAFIAARDEAAWESGHGGYTGTLAEKSDFVLLTVPKDTDPKTFANKLINDDDPRIRDKWGPAGCVKVATGEFLFFGWASS